MQSVQNVFIAVGGSGAKVAEALIRLLAIGFPTKFDSTGYATSAGDDLQIWRLDPDSSSGAAQALQAAVTDYAQLLDSLRLGPARNRWAMEIERDREGKPLVRHLNRLRCTMRISRCGRCAASLIRRDWRRRATWPPTRSRCFRSL